MTFNLSQWANTQSPAIPCQLVPPDLYQFQRRSVSALQAPAAPVTPGKLSPAVGAPMLSPKDLATVMQGTGVVTVCFGSQVVTFQIPEANLSNLLTAIQTATAQTPNPVEPSPSSNQTTDP